MLMPIVEPMTKTIKQQTNGLSSILSRYFSNTSFKYITPFMDYYILGQRKSQEKKSQPLRLTLKIGYLQPPRRFLSYTIVITSAL